LADLEEKRKAALALEQKELEEADWRYFNQTDQMIGQAVKVVGSQPASRMRKQDTMMIEPRLYNEASKVFSFRPRGLSAALT
jgi:hypothetical protein